MDWLKRQMPTAEKTPEEVRADAEIHDKEVELTYLRQGVDIAKRTSKEARVELRSKLKVARTSNGSLFEDLREGLKGRGP